MFQGLKTGMYYLRTKPAANAIQFTVDKSKVNAGGAVANGVNGTNGKATNGDSEEASIESINMKAMVCSLENKDDCMMCGS
jgi:ribonucleoside-diphosphate reductase subunit M1